MIYYDKEAKKYSVKYLIIVEFKVKSVNLVSILIFVKYLIIVEFKVQSIQQNME